MRPLIAFIVVFIAAALAGENVSFSILQTTDLHGYLTQTKSTPGILKLASAIRKEYVPEKTVLIDCGDSFEGSFDDAATKGAIMPPVFNALRYDIWVPGNHDFEWGLKRLYELSSTMKCQKLAANILVEGKPMPGFANWTVVERQGVKIAVIGVSSPYLAKWFWGDAFKGLEAKGINDSIEKIMPEILRAHPDLIVLAIHAGKLAPDRLGQPDDHLFNVVKKHPEIDLILGGHTHQKEPGARIGRSTWYVQPGMHAEALAKIDIAYDPATRRIAKLESHLIDPSGEQPDPETLKAVQPLLDEANALGSKVVTELKRKLGPTRKAGGENTLTNLIAQAVAEAAGTTASFHGSHTNQSIGPGPVTERMLHSAMPYENSIGVLELTPSQVRAIIEEQAALKDKTKGLVAYGLSYKLTEDGRIDGAITLPDGSPWTEEGKKLKIAFSSYDLASGGGRYPVLASIAASKEVNAVDAHRSTREAVLTLLRKPMK